MGAKCRFVKLLLPSSSRCNTFPRALPLNETICTEFFVGCKIFLLVLIKMTFCSMFSLKENWFCTKYNYTDIERVFCLFKKKKQTKVARTSVYVTEEDNPCHTLRFLLYYLYFPNSLDSQENSIAGQCNNIEKYFI